MDTTNPAKDAALRAPRQIWDFLRLLGILAATAVVVYLSALVLVLGVPEQNDYALASNLKHDRLESLTGSKVVLVGGSNLAFGIDSKVIEAATGCPAVNMGMNGYFGVRYMLEEVKPSLRAGDLVVLAFEWDNYFKGVDGTGANLLVVSKANPRAFGYLSWKQRLEVATAGVSYAARQKALRLVGDGLSYADSVVRGDLDDDDSAALMYNVETLAGFTPEGDLTSHLGVQWPFEVEQAIVSDTVDPEVVPLIGAFTREMEARGVRVVVSYTPLMKTSYDQHTDQIQNAYRLLSAELPGLLPRPPQDYVYDPSLFFDTVYHLNAEGRQLRTAQLAGDIVAGNPGTCGGTP